MPNIPKRPLDFQRYTRTKDAKDLLAKETLKEWGKIFQWDKNISAGSSSKRPNAPKSK